MSSRGELTECLVLAPIGSAFWVQPSASHVSRLDTDVGQSLRVCFEQ